MNGLPVINQLIALRADTGQEFASRIEGVGGSVLTLARPLDLPAEHELRVGAHVMTAWNVDNGINVLPCKLIGARREGLVSLWDVQVIGAAWREQRRSFVRASVMGTVKTSWSSREGDEYHASGVIADLSEAAVRFVTGNQELHDHARPGMTVEAVIRAPGHTFELEAEVVRVAASVGPVEPGEAPQWHAVLSFVAPGKAADEIRRLVFNQQLRERNGVGS